MSGMTEAVTPAGASATNLTSSVATTPTSAAAAAAAVTATSITVARSLSKINSGNMALLARLQQRRLGQVVESRRDGESEHGAHEDGMQEGMILGAARGPCCAAEDLVLLHAWPGPDIGELLHVLIQFDPQQYPVLWFSTNFLKIAALSLNPPVKQDRDEDMGMNVKRDQVDTFVPLCSYLKPEECNDNVIAHAFEQWCGAFGNSCDLTESELMQVLTFDDHASMIDTFLNAYTAVWLRDKGKLPDNVTSFDETLIFNCLIKLIDWADDDAKRSSDEYETCYAIVRHVLVCFTHVASKDYEKITRN